MNILEHYIKKVISVEKFMPPVPDDRDWVTVKMIVNCHGTITESIQLFTVDEWEKYKKQGYYMA